MSAAHDIHDSRYSWGRLIVTLAIAMVVREYINPEEAGARVGFVLMLTILGMALGGWMSGSIYDSTGSYGLAFVNGIVWNGLNISIIAVLLLRTRTREHQMVAA